MKNKAGYYLRIIIIIKSVSGEGTLLHLATLDWLKSADWQFQDACSQDVLGLVRDTEE